MHIYTEELSNGLVTNRKALQILHFKINYAIDYCFNDTVPKINKVKGCNKCFDLQ